MADGQDDDEREQESPAPWKMLFMAVLAFALAGFFLFLEELDAVAVLPGEAALTTSQGTIVAIESWNDDDDRRPRLRLSRSTYWYVLPRALRSKEGWLERELRRAPRDALITVLHHKDLPPAPTDDTRRHVTIFGVAIDDRHYLTYADARAAFEDDKKWGPRMAALLSVFGILFAFLTYTDFGKLRLKAEKR